MDISEAESGTLKLRREEARLLLSLEAIAHERIREPGVVGASSDAADHDVGLLTRHHHLLLRLQTDHRLME